MSAIHHNEIENTLRYNYGYQGNIIGVYTFRRLLLKLDSYDECCCHMDDFIEHMERGVQSYSFDYIFEEKYSRYKKIKLFAFWTSSIGESVRYLLAYYEAEYKNKSEDEYFLLVPYIKGNDFANGSFIENISRTVPMITYSNCHFWRYLVRKYPERFDLSSYNDYNGILVDAYNQFDERIPDGYFCDMKFPVISYIPEEKAEIEAKLSQMDISGDFVCIFARDNVYLQHQYGQSYSCNDIRNMDITSFKSATEYLAEQGIKAVRMGKKAGRPVNLPNCIDYASKYHSDLMDLYLCGNCKFYAGSLSGIVELSRLQSVPVVLIGLVQMGICNSLSYRSDDIYVPKKVYDRKSKKILKFTEMWDAEMEAKDRGAGYYEEQGLEFMEVSEHEIRAAIAEMNDKIDGTYIEDDYEKELQKRYHALLDKWIKKNNYRYFYFQHINISGRFVRENVFLLEE